MKTKGLPAAQLREVVEAAAARAAKLAESSRKQADLAHAFFGSTQFTRRLANTASYAAHLRDSLKLALDPND